MGLRRLVLGSFLAVYAASNSELSAKDETVREFLAKCAKENTCSSEVSNYLAAAVVASDKDFCTGGLSILKYNSLHPSGGETDSTSRPRRTLAKGTP
jgi:hypothetical protein